MITPIVVLRNPLLAGADYRAHTGVVLWGGAQLVHEVMSVRDHRLGIGVGHPVLVEQLQIGHVGLGGGGRRRQRRSTGHQAQYRHHQHYRPFQNLHHVLLHVRGTTWTTTPPPSRRSTQTSASMPANKGCSQRANRAGQPPPPRTFPRQPGPASWWRGDRWRWAMSKTPAAA